MTDEDLGKLFFRRDKQLKRLAQQWRQRSAALDISGHPGAAYRADALLSCAADLLDTLDETEVKP